MKEKKKHLYYLSELKDYKVDNHDHDIRGWKLKDLDHTVVGTVDNLLINKDLKKVVYVDVEVDQSIIDVNHDPYSPDSKTEFKEFINKEGENHIIIPIGLIDIHAEDKFVYTDSINYQTFAETKRYRSGTDINRNYENHVLGSYNRNRKDIRKDNEVERTRAAYDDENIHAKQSESVVDNHYRNKDIDKDSGDNFKRNDDLVNRDNEKSRRDQDFVRNDEEKIRQEKEQLRATSNDRKRPIDDHNRALDYNDKHQGLHPERSIDEDDSWTHQDRNLENLDDSDHERREKRESEFYNRSEFQERNRR
ncbi:hypothetical protein [Christiangramia forsetii]|nr:hypothetical protein [Christiangramia forsetii]